MGSRDIELGKQEKKNRDDQPSRPAGSGEGLAAEKAISEIVLLTFLLPAFRIQHSLSWLPGFQIQIFTALILEIRHP